MATVADPGMVMSHVSRISRAFVQRTALGRSDAPIPMMDELTTWVVDTGAPTMEAAKITDVRSGAPIAHLQTKF